MREGRCRPGRRHRGGRRGHHRARGRAGRDRSTAKDSHGRGSRAGAAGQAGRPDRSAARRRRRTGEDRHRQRSSSRRSVEGAVLAIDNRTGQIRAMVGGFSFERSKFNRATQAYRQVGSAFKPIVFTAAIDRGYTPALHLMDMPVSFPAGARPAALLAAELRPASSRASHAAPRARTVAQRAGGAADGRSSGPKQVIMFARRLGLESAIPAVPAGRARRGGSHAAGDDERLFGVPEPGRAHEAVPDPEGHRPLRQRARGEPAGTERRDPRRHRVCR